MNTAGVMGTRIDRYEIQKLLGAGGFGAVYLAKHVHTDALAALKVLKKQVSLDPSLVERFLREAKAAAAVGSDAIVRVSDAGVSNEGQAFLVMEYLEGCDLKELALREGPLHPMRVVNLILQVLEGLGAAHARGIVHRDMKPANVFITRKEGGPDREVVKLLDFGISKMHGEGDASGLTMSGVAMGTPSYMSPEQFFDARNVDGRADLYSVAVMLYELLAKRLPFDADSFASLVVKVRTEAAPSLQQIAPSVPPALANAVMVGLAKEREKRWSDAAEFSAALRAAMGLPPKAVSAPKPVTQPSGPKADSASMMLGDTATPPPRGQVIQPNQLTSPQRGKVTPNAPARPAAPNVSNVQASPSLHQEVKNLGAPPLAIPPLTPLTGGTGPGANPPKKNNTVLIVAVILGLLFVAGGCCFGGLIMIGMQAEQEEAARKAKQGTGTAPMVVGYQGDEAPAAPPTQPGADEDPTTRGLREMREATSEVMGHEVGIGDAPAAPADEAPPAEQ